MSNVIFYLWNWWGWPLGGVTTSSQLDAAHSGLNTLIQTGDLTWRSSAITDQYMVRDMGKPRKISSIGIVGHNLSRTGRFKVQVGTDPGFSSGVEGRIEDIPAWPRIGLEDEWVTGSLRDFFYTSGIPYLETQAILQRPIIIVDFDIPVYGRYVRVDIHDPENIHPYIELAYIYAGERYEPIRGIVYGFQRARTPAVRSSRATNGEYTFQTPFLRRMTFNMQLELETHKNIKEKWLMFSTLLGTREEFLVRVFPERFGYSSSTQFYHTMYCRFLHVPVFKNVAYELYTIPITLEEIL